MTPEDKKRLGALLYRTQSFSELAEVFELLWLECREQGDKSEDNETKEYWRGRSQVWSSAAQMVRQQQEIEQEKQGDGTNERTI